MKDDEATQVHELKNLLPQTEEKPRSACLVVLSGSDIGRMHRVGPLTLLGRSRKCQILLEEDGVSREHAQLRRDRNGQFVIEDLGSTNGTLLNGRTLVRPTPVADGDKIQIGGAVILKFSLHDALDEDFQQRLYESAVRDHLTGAFNKRYLTERLDQEFAAAERRNRPLSLVVLDLDHFKTVNDTYGHDVGDQVLRQVAETIQGGLRREEVFARYGGEEFVLLMRDTSLADAMRGAERIRALVQRDPIALEDGGVVPITASVGVASTDGAWHHSAMRLFIRADRNLFKAKQAGRNIVVGPRRCEG